MFFFAYAIFTELISLAVPFFYEEYFGMILSHER
jgi:hypothetical protein